eukprot:GHRR01001558.1.p2 GENE.GHRR01001558.1~~GHRR01001558.1.p2  ORF type:complete len:147 (+),score=28.79 GHRR01001558.1:804-1244(+)
MDCLKQWVCERGSLECELCSKQYKDGIKQRLELTCSQHIRRRHCDAAAAAHAGSQAGGQAGQVQTLKMRLWVDLGICSVLIGVVLSLALTVDVAPDGQVWKRYLFGSVVGILLVFLFVRVQLIVFAMLTRHGCQRRHVTRQGTGAV